MRNEVYLISNRLESIHHCSSFSRKLRDADAFPTKSVSIEHACEGISAKNPPRYATRGKIPRDAQRDITKQTEKQKVAFGEEEVIVWHTESMLR
jgi:hypothetical protein